MFPYRNLRIIHRVEEKEHLLSSLLAIQQPTIVSFLNAHAVTSASYDDAFKDDLLAASYLLRDGVGLEILLRVLGCDPGLNMNGSDLTPEIIRTFSGRRIALCGTRDPWLSRAREAVESMGGRVVLCLDGFHAPSFYVDQLSSFKADLVILAMGMPKQEAVSVALARALSHPVVIVNGGAILDFMAKRFPRAPMAWREAHLEWLFRLLREPRRLSRRYLWGGVKFLILVVRFFFEAKRDVAAHPSKSGVFGQRF